LGSVLLMHLVMQPRRDGTIRRWLGYWSQLAVSLHEATMPESKQLKCLP
jgi:hypothetical protein